MIIIIIIIFIIRGDLLIRLLYDQWVMTTTLPKESEICCESKDSWPLQIKSVVFQPGVSFSAFFFLKPYCIEAKEMWETLERLVNPWKK